MTIWTTLSLISKMKVDTPSLQISTVVFQDTRRSVGRRRTISRLEKKRSHRTHRADKAWEIRVARAAPATPQPRTATKRRSSTTLTTEEMMR